MSTEQSKPRFAVVAPVFWVADVARARTYYTDQLGFDVEFEWVEENEDGPRYVILRKDSTELHISKSEQQRPSIAYFFVDGVREYYDALTNTDAIITEHIQDFAWQMREFEVADVDGNKMIFGEHLSRLENGGNA